MNAIAELLNLTSRFADRPDLIQGPGGNTSFKDDSGHMFIKASGFRFEELNADKGVSCVDYRAIGNYFYGVKPADISSEEKIMLKVVAENILNNENGEFYPKPSMETGFHAVLDKYVVHTHSVWTNLVNCSSDRTSKIEELRKLTGMKIVDIPFVSPGFGLSYLVTSAIQNSEGSGPKLFLLANHGVIAHSNSPDEVEDLLNRLDKTISRLFNMNMNYPDTSIDGIGSEWSPTSEYVIEQIKKHNADESFFERVLFPDQTVFFKNNISFDINSSNKINVLGKELIYKCGEREARSIHETMTAYLFIYDTLIQSGNEPKFISQIDIDYINSMDMEKHRKSLFK